MAPRLRVDFDPLLDESSSSFGSTDADADTATSTSTSSSSMLDSSKNNTNKNKKRGRSVVFCQHVQIHTIPSRMHLSKQEMESLYLSRQDLSAIKRGLIFRMKELERLQGQTTRNGDDIDDDDDDTTANNNNNSNDDTLRGLEACASKTAMERRRRIDVAVQTVLRQQRLGVHDDELVISRLYGKFVQPSVLTARLRGLQDEQQSPYGYQSSSPKQMVMVRS